MDLSGYMAGSYFKPDEVKAAMETGKPLIGTIISEPVVVETQFKNAKNEPVKRIEFDVQLEDGREKTASLNMTSTTSIGKVYGAESQKWIGRKVKFTTALTNVKGKMQDVIYVYPAEAAASPATVTIAPAPKTEQSVVRIQIIKDDPSIKQIVAPHDGKTYDLIKGTTLDMNAKDAQFLVNMGFAIKVVEVQLTS